jgi:hypothetical protein
MKTSLAIVCTLAIVSTACVQQNRFRYVRLQPECFGGGTATDPVPGAPNEKRDFPSIDCRHRDYSVAFVEFDKNGKALDPNQKKKALELIASKRRSAPGGKIITLVYVHGWKNNANQMLPGRSPQDVERFESAMSELAFRSGQAAAAAGQKTPVPIVGVYIGWPGKSLMGPGWFTFASYWGRRNTANRVGDGPDLAPTLNDVIDATNNGSTSSRVMLVGHSFGARVLEHAIETGKVRLFDAAANAAVVSPRVDLTLYVNSANDARLSMARIEALRDRPISVRHPDYDPATCNAARATQPQCRAYPLLVAVTSHGDLATKYLLPTANTINLDSSAKTPPSPVGTFLDPIPSASTYKRAAAGHLEFLHSHDVREIPCPTADQVDAEAARRRTLGGTVEPREVWRTLLACKADDPRCQFTFRTLGGEEASCYQVDSRANASGPQPFNTTAFWVMAVDPAVIKDHGDIWNQSFIQMLGELMAPRRFFDPAAPRVQLRAQ